MNDRKKSGIRCAICSKPLSDPKSVQRGIGPICWKKKELDRIKNKNGCIECGHKIFQIEKFNTLGLPCNVYCCGCCPYSDNFPCPRENIKLKKDLKNRKNKKCSFCNKSFVSEYSFKHKDGNQIIQECKDCKKKNQRWRNNRKKNNSSQNKNGNLTGFFDKDPKQINNNPTIEDYFNKLYNPRCLKCGTDLDLSNLKHYEHEGGLLLRKYLKKQWLFAECSECQYDSNYSKLLHYFEKKEDLVPIVGITKEESDKNNEEFKDEWDDWFNSKINNF